jgi:DNA polymerase-3 subunit alpha
VRPAELVELCKKNHMPAVCVSDTNNLFCSLEFSQSAASNGIQPIIGCSLNVLRESKSQATRRLPSATPEFDNILLIAKNPAGYQNLLKLVSRAYTHVEDAAFPHTTTAQLLELNEGLIVLTGGHEGAVGRLILEGQHKEAETYLLSLKEAFGDRLYIELQRHDLEEQQITEPVFVKMGLTHNIPFVATNNVYFADQGMHKAHDALFCIAAGRYVEEKDRRKVNAEHYFKSTRQMQELFKDIPEAVANTSLIAKRCAVMSEARAPMLPRFSSEAGRDEADELRAMAEAGLKKRLETHVFTEAMSAEEKDEIAKPYFDRLSYEMDVIINMEFPGYFLIVSDFIKWSKRHDIPVGPGRGSGAGSIVAWALEITDLNPLRFGLLFERFLNPERVSMPDFDIDFCQERREEVIHYVQDKYGKDKVAQIITFGKLQAKAVIRDVGRVLQMPYGQLDRISKMIPFNPLDPITLDKALEMDRVLRRMRDEDAEVRQLFDIGLKLEGLNRHASTHAAGVVIGDRPLEELIPVYKDPRSEMPVTGYSMKYTESSGLVKFDFLGLKTLTVIAKACDFIRQKGVEIDIGTIDLEDPPTYEMLSKGKTVGVFQLESAGMRDTLRKLRPDNIDDIIALISLYRPGPMDNIPSYIARKHEEEEPDYLHPMLEDVLKETYGVIIYQEQVMQIAQIMGGYTLGGADLLRRAMGKKIASEMDKQRQIFVEGAVKNKVAKAKASSIFDLVAKFAGYGFNKSHAAAYAMISYQTAYLKANYPVEFLAASLNLEINDTDKINTFCQDVNEHNIPLLLPDINQSDALFVPQKDENGTLGIRYALGALKNVGVSAMKELVRERKENGDFTDIFDVAARVGSKYLNKRMLENLIKAGAFDHLHDNRCALCESVDAILKYGAMVQESKNSDQSSLFGGDSGASEPKPELKPVDDWHGTERLAQEFAAIGLYLSAHPIDAYASALSHFNTIACGDFEAKLDDGNNTITVAGVITSKKIKSSARGRYATLLLSDPTGLFEASIYNEDLIAEKQDILENGSIVMVKGNARKDEGGIRFSADDINSLDETIDKQSISTTFYITQDLDIQAFKKLLSYKSEGYNTPVTIILHTDNKEVTLQLPNAYSAPLSALPDFENLSGVKKVVQ